MASGKDLKIAVDEPDYTARSPSFALEKEQFNQKIHELQEQVFLMFVQIYLYSNYFEWIIKQRFFF